MSSPPSLYAADESMPVTPSDQQLPSTSRGPVCGSSKTSSGFVRPKGLSVKQDLAERSKGFTTPLTYNHHQKSGSTIRPHESSPMQLTSIGSDQKVPSSGTSKTSSSTVLSCATAAYVPRAVSPTSGRVPRMSEPDPFVEPAQDSNILTNDRVLVNLLRRELLGRSELLDYFQVTQTEIKPRMRVMVTEWMSDVCAEEGMESEVFPLAISYLDRFLSIQPVFKEQFQGLAAACIFVASKVKQPVPVTATRIAHYTDNSATVGQLISWELLILSRLGWDVSSVTGLEFAEHIIARLELPGHVTKQLRGVVQGIINSMLKDFKFALWRPSVQAAVAVCLAAGYCLPNTNVMPSFIAGVSPILGVDQDQIRMCVEAVKSSFFQSEDSENQDPSKTPLPVGQPIEHPELPSPPASESGAFYVIAA